MKHSTNQRDPRGVSPEDMAALRAIGTDISNSDNSDIDQQQNNMNEDNDPDRGREYGICYCCLFVDCWANCNLFGRYFVWIED